MEAARSGHGRGRGNDGSWPSSNSAPIVCVYQLIVQFAVDGHDASSGQWTRAVTEMHKASSQWWSAILTAVYRYSQL